MIRSDFRNNFCEKYKWFDWFDDNILFYIWDIPYSIYLTIRYWFRCNWNKEHYNLIKQSVLSYGWDHEFLTALEELQIDKMIKEISEHHHMVEEQYEQIIRTLRIAKYCVHIINNSTCLYEIKRNENTNEIWETVEIVYTGPKLNVRNTYRFMNKKYADNCIKNSRYEEIYLAKCKHLYYLTREYYTHHWWN